MKNKYLFVTIFLAVLVIVGGYLVYKIPSPSDNMGTASGDTLGAETNTDMNEQVEIQDEIIGKGAEAVSGKSVTVNYVGTLTDGTIFDSNTDPTFGHVEPFTFNLGAGEVIAGWDQGVVGMKVGGKRKLVIPPSLGYGAADLGAIPPNSTLIFEVDLLKVE